MGQFSSKMEPISSIDNGLMSKSGAGGPEVLFVDDGINNVGFNYQYFGGQVKSFGDEVGAGAGCYA